MTAYRFRSSYDLQGTLPDFFYNSHDYLAFIKEQGGTEIFSFFLVTSEDKVLARIHFQCCEGHAKSHWRAPFGFLETAVFEEKCLSEFWDYVEYTLKQNDIHEIQLVSWPSCYLPEASAFLWDFFLRRGFAMEYEDLNFHLPVTDKSAYEFFLRPERKRVRKCRAFGLEARIWENPDAGVVYDALWRMRQQRNIPLTISKERFMESLHLFPEKYLVVVVREKEDIIALSVGVVVTESIFYHFYSASDEKYHSLSPSVLLYERLYLYCQQSGYSLLDFGLASIRGVKQESLYQFKEKLGGLVSGKPTFRKKIDHTATSALI